MKKRIIVIEGADNTGKTTLAKFIANKWSAAGHPTIYFHFDHTERLGRAMFDYMRSVHENLLWCHDNLGHSVVLDRSWPSEIIYGTVIGPPERLVEFEHEKIRAMLNGKVVYVHASCQSGTQRHLNDSAHDHSLYTPREYADLRMAYGQWGRNLGKSSPMCKYDMDIAGSQLDMYCSLIEGVVL